MAAPAGRGRVLYGTSPPAFGSALYALRRANDIGQDHAGVWASPDPQDVSLPVLRSRGDAGSPAGGSAAERRGDATFVGSPKPLALTRMSSGERCIRARSPINGKVCHLKNDAFAKATSRQWQGERTVRNRIAHI